MDLESTLYSQIADALQEQIRLLRELEAVLQTEYTALRRIDISNIEDCSDQKSHLNTAIERSISRACEAAQKLGYSGEDINLESCVEVLAGQDKSSERVRSELAHATRRCRELNRRNGQLISAGLGEVTGLLALIWNDNSDQPGTYDASGNTVQTRLQKSILNSA